MSNPSLGNLYSTLLAPVIISVTTLSLLRLRDWRRLRRGEKIVIAFIFLFLLLTQIRVAGTKYDQQRTEPLFLESAIVVISVFLWLIWRTGKRYPIGIGLIALIYMILFNVLEGGALPFVELAVQGWLPIAGSLLALFVPAIVIPTVSIVGLDMLEPLRASAESGQLVRKSGRLILIILIIGSFLYTVVWLCIWDRTDDGIRGILMIFVTVMASLAAGLVVAVNTLGWRRWAGFVVAVLVILGVGWAVVGPGNRFPPEEITQARAASLQKAIEEFKNTGRSYPGSLGELVPGKLLRIPRPMIVRGEEWCYQGDRDYYRLGAIYREHWSSPHLSVRVYASGGNVPDQPWSCDERLAELMSHQEAAMDPSPLSTPQPTSIAPTKRTTVEPVVEAGKLTIGTWSPNGATLVFGVTGYSGDSVLPMQIELQFIDGDTGEICRPVERIWKADGRSDGLHGHYAWLPDGRFLHVSESGEMATINPCVGGWKDLFRPPRVVFTGVASFHVESGRVLLKDQDSYELMNGISFGVQPISAVMPAAAENQDDRYSWSPSGHRVAISRRNGQDAGQAAAIHIIDGGSGEAVVSIPLASTSEYPDAPVVDWLNPHEILVQFADSLLIIDLDTDPPKATDLIHEKFLLDLSYPTDFSSMDFVRSLTGDEYHIAVRANHPHNRDVYLYSSTTGQVSIFQHDTHSLFFFPDGQCMRLPQWEDLPTYRDEYEVVWMDDPLDERRLVVQGHVPRSQPQLLPVCLSDSTGLIFSSSQGVSLVSTPDDKTVRFWELIGGAARSTQTFVSPSRDGLVVVTDEKHLYYIPLP
jgi:hypothetical protein